MLAPKARRYSTGSLLCIGFGMTYSRNESLGSGCEDSDDDEL